MSRENPAIPMAEARPVRDPPPVVVDRRHTVTTTLPNCWFD
jgi:hypothetical protein